MNRCRQSMLAGLLLLGGVCRADQFPDDHADGIAGATLVAFSNQGGAIEIDTDRDVFQFVAQPGRQYGLTVTPGTLKDATIRLRSSDGLYALATVHSVGTSQATLVYPHAIGSATVFLEVCGFAKYTAGSYTLNVSDQAVVDTDYDDLADIWETSYFSNLAQTASGDFDGDGMSNGDEYALGYDPLDSGSRFVVTEADLGGVPRTLTWVSTPYRSYDVQAAGSATDTNWVTVGSVPGTPTTASFSDSSPGTDSNRFWRIKAR